MKENIMKEELTVFNDKATAYKTGIYPLFGGEEPSLYDSVNMPYPKFKDLMEQLKELDWSPQDVDLSESRMDLINMTKEMRELSLLNLAYQWSIDSIATSIPSLLSPFITNTEYGHVILRIGENECNHADTYSDIVRQCVPDPQEVFSMVFENDKVLDRSEVINKTLSELKQAGAEYTLGLKTFEESKPYILKGLVAIYALERISFMSSFACTFALAEQGYLVGVSRLVQKILIDEMIHFETQRYALQDILLKDSKWKLVYEEHKESISDIVYGVIEQEMSWNSYLFNEGRVIVGLNENILNEWTLYCGQEVVTNLGIPHKENLIKECPLPWFEQDWMDLNSQQNANMESDATNYMVSAVSKNLEGLNLNFGFNDFGSSEVLKGKNTLVVYTKDFCPFCVKLKEFLKLNNYYWIEYNISEDDLAREYLLKEGYTTVPQVFNEDFTVHLGDCTSFIKDNT